MRRMVSRVERCAGACSFASGQEMSQPKNSFSFNIVQHITQDATIEFD